MNNANITGVVLWVMGAVGVLFLYAAFTGNTPASIVQSFAVPGTAKKPIGGSASTTTSATTSSNVTTKPAVPTVSFASQINASGTGEAGTINSPAAAVMNV